MEEFGLVFNPLLNRPSSVLCAQGPGFPQAHPQKPPLTLGCAGGLQAVTRCGHERPEDSQRCEPAGCPAATAPSWCHQAAPGDTGEPLETLGSGNGGKSSSILTAGQKPSSGVQAGQEAGWSAQDKAE